MYKVESFTGSNIIVTLSQQGSVMLFALVIIALLSSFSLLGMKNTIQANKLTQGFSSYQLALVRAESAIRVAELKLAQLPSLSINVQGEPEEHGLYLQLNSPFSSNVWSAAELKKKWLDKKYVLLQQGGDDGAVDTIISSYFIEKLLLHGSDINTQYFRITARGLGRAEANAVILQTIVCYTNQMSRVSWQQLQ
ncbi:MAG: hypothetical protein HRU06_10110 [Oceanospirillaceae bacterium]|nr:hypothetical protein [Oceanospirillaceae bacterium]